MRGLTLLLLILAAIAIYYLFINKGANKLGVYSGKGETCPNCKNPVEESFNVCPICKETLKKKCEKCGEKVNAEWKYCPYCESLLNKDMIR